ncbi:MAG: hypothetical protein V3S83_11425 [Gemmatimonadota bacterium]
MRRGRLRTLARASLALGVLYLAAGYVSARLDWVPSQPTVIAVELESLPISPYQVAVAVAVHTERSHDALGDASEVVSAARAAQLDAVLTTDHRSSDAPSDLWSEQAVFKEAVLLVRGQEVSLGSDVGRVLVFGLDTAIVAWDGSLESFALKLQRDRATAIVAHSRSPRKRDSWRPTDTQGIVGWEVFDFADIARARLSDPWLVYHLLALASSAPLGRAHHSLARLHRAGFDQPAVAAFDSVYSRGRITAVGGLDVHPKWRIGGGLVPGYTPFFRAMANHFILSAPLPSDAESAREAVVETLAAGRVYISFFGPEGARGFTFAAASADAVARAAGVAGAFVSIGGEVAFSPGLVLVAGFAEREPGRLLYRIVRDGATLQWVRGDRLSVPLLGPGVYRLEVYRYSLRVGPLLWNRRPWIFTNPIRVTAEIP